MATVKTKFSPLKHGFRFQNYFQSTLDVKFNLPLVGKIDLSKVIFGLCGGMCFAALDFFNEGDVVPENSDSLKLEKKLFTYLCDRQLDSLQIPVLLKIIEWMLAENSQITTRMTRYEIPKLRRRLDKDEPTVLCLIRVQGWGNPTLNHQVLATGYDYDEETKKMVIELYDPNHPGKEPTISLDLSAPRNGLNLRQSTGEELRGFFEVPYRRPFYPQLVHEAAGTAGVQFGLETTALVPGISLRWPVDSSRINQLFGENPASYRPFGLPGHEGLDLYALSGANVYAAADGEIAMAKNVIGHPYGKQVRIHHQQNGIEFETVYAHLSKFVVQEGQHVKSGELIGLADNTGNSFGDHLHLTLKIRGQTTPGYPGGIVDPLPYLRLSQPENIPHPNLPASSGVFVYTNLDLNLRSEPSTSGAVIGILPAGEQLDVLGDAAVVTALIGKADKWLQVKTAAGQAGFVAAWLCVDTQQSFPPTDLIVYPFDIINLRSGPGTGFPTLGELTLNDPLTVLGDEELSRGKLGREGLWLQVQTQQGTKGFVAAWLVHETGQTAPVTDLIVFPTGMVNLRARPTLEGNILTVVTPADALKVLGDKEAALARIGQDNMWINVKAPTGHSGYVASQFVRLEKPAAPVVTGNKLIVFPTVGINLRAQPSANSPRVDGVLMNEEFEVIEADLTAAAGKIGRQDAWVFGQKANGKRGWAAAWLLSRTKTG